MKSLVCSDMHDHVDNLKSALMLANTANCDSVICCGDLCSPFRLSNYNDNCELPFHMVFGNNEGDRFHMANKCHHLNINRLRVKNYIFMMNILLAEKNHGWKEFHHKVHWLYIIILI